MSLLTIQLMLESRDVPTPFQLAGRELLPCPFCGSKHIVFHDEDGIVALACYDCGAEGPVRGDRLNAIAIWQKR